MIVKVPRRIEVIIHPYDILLLPYLKDDDGFRGDCNTRRQQIRVDPGLPPSQRMYVLCHEIGEAIKDAYTCGVTHEDLSLITMGFAEFLTKLGIEFDWSDVEDIK